MTFVLRPSRFAIVSLHALLVLSLVGGASPLSLVKLVAAENAALVERRLAESAAYLASDELEGRGVGTKGLDKAADYLAREFRQLGLKTELFNGTPFQTFKVTVSTELGPKEQNKLSIVGPPAKPVAAPARWDLALGEDFTPMAAGGSGKVDAPLVFAGYGITAKDLEYDDYAGVDVKGKVVVLLRKEPQANDPTSKFDGEKPSQHALFMRKISNAFEHGAAAIIFVNDANELRSRRDQETKLWNDALDRLAKLTAERPELSPEKAADIAKHADEVSKAAEQVAETSKRLEGDLDSILPFSGAGDSGTRRKTPVFFARRSVIDQVLKSAGQPNLATIEEEIDADLQPRSIDLKGFQAVGEANIVQNEAEVKNVIAVLEGEGPLADETIVVGAHYDHLGEGGAGSLAPWTTAVHNGADDNASGTATLLEVARQLATSNKKPQRRIVFMAFTGEERGLLGSAHYVREPRFPLERTIAMFNLDMVGRLNDDKLIVYGTGTAKEFEPLVDELGSKHGFQLTKYPGGFGPSDHSSFYGKNIPVLHFFTGTHSDYHRPSDDSDKLNIAGMRRVADMVVDTVLATDTAKSRPEYVQIKKVEVIGGGDGDRPYFGSIPDFGQNVEGYAISGAAPGSPADKGGLKAGDVIVQLGESKIANLEDFDSALRKYKIGDKVKVVVQRDGKEVELQVTLERRKQ
jgi:hypothetical protein